jgi:hypothetical protein
MHRKGTVELKVLVALSCLIFALSLPTRAPAQEQVSLQGEVVDLACYMSKGSRGPAHKACAQLCAKKGVPIGLLTEAGNVYLLLDDHANPEPYEEAQKLAGDNAKISGKKYTRPGIASIVVGAAEGL